MKFNFDHKSQFHSVDLSPGDSGKFYRATIKENAFDLEILRVENGRMDLLIDGQRVIAYVSSDMAKRWVTVDGHTGMLTKTSAAKRGVRHDHAGGLTAPMPGQVRSVSVSVGDAVKKGQTLLTIEAMKMEIRIQALKDGRVKALHASQGQTVEREQILIEMEDAV